MYIQKFDQTLLSDPRLTERDACGVGVVAHMKGVRKHQIVSSALEMLHRMDHRGGLSSDNQTSDGVGVLLQIPHTLFQRFANEHGCELPEAGRYAVAQCFLPNDPVERDFWTEKFQTLAVGYGLELLFNRHVPTQASIAGPLASEHMPFFEQFVFKMSPQSTALSDQKFKLYFFRKELELIARSRYGVLQKRFHIVSFSNETICYKALVQAQHLGRFYPDLTDPLFDSAFALAHLRFSTNTQPSWALAQPFRTICHNGEINTLRGNINAMYARSPLLRDLKWQEQLDSFGPVCVPGLSDSAMLDNMTEFLLLSGRSVAHVMSMLVPEPWQKNESMSEPLRDFYEYHSYQMEPWDGPALIGFYSEGQVGAVLDRNGLRPGRYCITHDDIVVLASEAGVLPQPWSHIRESGRLSPGRIFLVDMNKGCVVSNEHIKKQLSEQQPYGEWLNAHRVKLADLKQQFQALPLPSQNVSRANSTHDTRPLPLTQQLLIFGYTREELRTQMTPMALTGKEAVGSMGSDIPLAVLSKNRPLLFEYFKQGFAQVTNPPIDVIREVNVTSLSSYLGAATDLLQKEFSTHKVISLDRPILTSDELSALKTVPLDDFQIVHIDTVYDAASTSLEDALKNIHNCCLEHVQQGASVLILSDRCLSSSTLPIPSLLAVSSVHHFLMRKGLRGRCSIIAETGEARDTHQCALLISYGASAVNPYLALELISQRDFLPELAHISDRSELVENYVSALCDGILKITSKMGITDLNSYRGAQIFEALGLSQKTIDEHFTWTQSRIGGIGLQDIERDVQFRHQFAFKADRPRLEIGGKMQWNREGEKHLHSPEMIAQLQNSVRINSQEEFNKYCETVDLASSQGQNLRGLLTFRTFQPPIAVDEVESVRSIVKRFCTGAMSLGSISREAHESIALAMNRTGGRSNSGEGGEDPERYAPDHNGEYRLSQTKQIASGRFGVTLDYLLNATELQIKIAQGAKPGEGGQLPGDKVDPYIARLRHSTPGVTLISPPPHHDIYSIEDLAQVIHDLKNANRDARINVKLVSSSGIGTVACGVVKAKAEAILISGAEGGTGASPVSSILHAGLPWELGLAEVHKSLTETNLRNRVVLQVDGQLRTPRDLAVAALLGAQEWGIATGALLSLGCIMMRKCHLNTCPVGIATQDPELRKKFEGQPEHLINYLFMLAEGLRSIMAVLGFKSVDEMIGRSDCLDFKKLPTDAKTSLLDLSALLSSPPSGQTQRLLMSEPQQHGIETGLDERILIPAVRDLLTRGVRHEIQAEIRSTDRSTGTRLSSELLRWNKQKSHEPVPIHLRLKGTAGQSFMAFAAADLTVKLLGEANDYVCKGLSGASVALIPDPTLMISDSQNVICGNAALYGATSGKLYVRGIAGERFAVRNSGAIAVVEGVGDHGCEYMTGGTVVILGRVGRNFGAGMSGGRAFIYDPHTIACEQLNTEMVELNRQLNEGHLTEIREELESYYETTQSPLARCILQNWGLQKNNFAGVIPKSSELQISAHTTTEKPSIDSIKSLPEQNKSSFREEFAHE